MQHRSRYAKQLRGPRYYTNRRRGKDARAYKVLQELDNGQMQLLSMEGHIFETSLDVLKLWGYRGQQTTPACFKRNRMKTKEK